MENVSKCQYGAPLTLTVNVSRVMDNSPMRLCTSALIWKIPRRQWSSLEYYGGQDEIGLHYSSQSTNLEDICWWVVMNSWKGSPGMWRIRDSGWWDTMDSWARWNALCAEIRCALRGWSGATSWQSWFRCMSLWHECGVLLIAVLGKFHSFWGKRSKNHQRYLVSINEHYLIVGGAHMAHR